MKQLLLLMAICIIGDKLVCQKSLKSNLDSTLYKKVDSLIQLSRVHTDKREFDKAFELIKIAEKLQKENKDTLNSIYGRVCLNFGRVLFYKGYDMNDVEHWYLKAISIQQKTLGNKHPEYSNSLISLANLYYKFGLYEKSKTLYLEANKIQEKALGKENSTYALSLNNLALVYSEMGFYGKAEPLFLESRIIREKVLGKDHPNYASSLTNLAILHTKKGDYSMAEPLF
ncbi:MAG: tetratricopeptide repeat protein [Saprospiraceae bacterium]